MYIKYYFLKFFPPSNFADSPSSSIQPFAARLSSGTEFQSCMRSVEEVNFFAALSHLLLFELLSVPFFAFLFYWKCLRFSPCVHVYFFKWQSLPCGDHQFFWFRNIVFFFFFFNISIFFFTGTYKHHFNEFISFSYIL